MEHSCVFCRIVNGRLPASKVYEDEEVLAIMDINPINNGHLLVMPKQCYTLLKDVPNELALKVFAVLLKIEKVMWDIEGVRCEGTNVLQNNGKSAWQEVNHVHFHIIPRFKSDSFKIKYEMKKPSRATLQLLSERIKEQLG